MYGVLRKLNQFLGGMSLCPPSIRDVANTFAQLLVPSGEFPGHRFSRSKISKTKLQKMQKTQKNAKNAKYVSSNKGVFLEAWRLCQRHGDHAKGLGTKGPGKATKNIIEITRFCLAPF